MANEAVGERMNRLLVDSLHINTTGGLVLLDQLVTALEEKRWGVHYLFDKRVVGRYDVIPRTRRLYVHSNLVSRVIFYFKYGHKYGTIFSFANFPPIGRLKYSKIYTYFHNILLLEPNSVPSRKEKFSLSLKKGLLWILRYETTLWFVQTERVGQKLLDVLQLEPTRIQLAPFYLLKGYSPSQSRVGSYFYASSAAPHKNHIRLLQAWEILLEKGYAPKLHLTVGEDCQEIISFLDRLNRRGAKIVNHGLLPYEQVLQIYSRVQYCIFPSLSESFGLPLIEATLMGCKVLCSDKNYAYEVIQPSRTFDPHDAGSIADAVIYTQSSTTPNPICLIDTSIDHLLDYIH